MDEYFKDACTIQEMRDQFTEMVGDFWMIVPAIREARYYLSVVNFILHRITAFHNFPPIDLPKSLPKFLISFKQMLVYPCTCMSSSTGQRFIRTPDPAL